MYLNPRAQAVMDRLQAVARTGKFSFDLESGTGKGLRWIVNPQEPNIWPPPGWIDYEQFGYATGQIERLLPYIEQVSGVSTSTGG